METIDIIWIILGIITVIMLLGFWRKRNAAWGGLTLGVIIGAIIVALLFFKGNGFSWHTIGKGAIVGALLGFGAEMLGKISDRIKRKQQ